MKRMLNNMSALAVLIFLTACGTMPQPSEPATGTQRVPSAVTTRPLNVGAIIINQSPQVDREVSGRNADQYFVDMRRALDSGRSGVVGAAGEVTLTLRAGEQVFWSERVTLQGGYARSVIPLGTRLPVDTALCVETSGRIAHQRVRPDFARDGQNVMCTSGNSIFRFFNIDRRTGTYFVMAIKSGG